MKKAKEYDDKTVKWHRSEIVKQNSKMTDHTALDQKYDWVFSAILRTVDPRRNKRNSLYIAMAETIHLEHIVVYSRHYLQKLSHDGPSKLHDLKRIRKNPFKYSNATLLELFSRVYSNYPINISETFWRSCHLLTKAIA